MRLIYSGKVRDVYEDGADIVLVASDRVSVHDTPLPTPIPDKGKILTQLSLWWFERLSHLVSNHVLSASAVPVEWKGRAIRCKRLDMIPVECVARGYLTGAASKEYLKSGSISGVALPLGLVEASRLPVPIFTPTTKGDAGRGEHDELLNLGEVAGLVGHDVADELRHATLQVFAEGGRIALERGLILADTKLEWGWDVEGNLVLGDELLSPDSARFWLTEQWTPGRPQQSLDKQFLRDWAAELEWDWSSGPPEIPDEVVESTRQRYLNLYHRITGNLWRDGA